MFPEDLDLLHIPKRSRLYCLEPIAVATPYVEGLISYICRLAEAHCVSPGVLIKQEILPCFRKSYSISGNIAYRVQDDGATVSISSFRTPQYRKNLNEYGLLAWQYLEGLKPLTLREDLQALVIPPDANKILQDHTGKTLIREFRAWCPDCFQAWLVDEHPLYEPLFWSVAAVTICPFHYKPLQSRCPYCDKIQRPFSARMYVARCSQCSAWLNIYKKDTSKIELAVATEAEGHLRVVRQVLEAFKLWNHLSATH